MDSGIRDGYTPQIDRFKMKNAADSLSEPRVLTDSRIALKIASIRTNTTLKATSSLPYCQNPQPLVLEVLRSDVRSRAMGGATGVGFARLDGAVRSTRDRPSMEPSPAA